MKRSELTPKMIAGMSPDDQARYSPEPRPSWEDDPHPPPVTDKLEREEQRLFASDCLRKGYAIVWHSTAHRSKASLGCPDFVIGLQTITLWIEFKRAPNKLTEDQRKFRETLEAQGIPYYVVYSCDEAIKLVETCISDSAKLASWMIGQSFATGHGDNMDGLLRELSWQVQELRDRIWELEKD